MNDDIEQFVSSPAFTDAPIAYSVSEPDGGRITVNRAFRELFRVEHEPPGIEGLTHQEDRARTAAYLAALREGRRDRVIIDKRYVRGDGSVFWGRLTATAARGADGAARYLIGVIQDVTADMESLSRMGSASEAKSNFVARVSHDLRTPLHAIHGLAELLAVGDLDPQQRRLAETIQGEASRLQTLVDDLLDLSRLEAGRLEIGRRPFALEDCVRSATALLAERARDREVALAVDVEPEVAGEVEGDPDRLRQVLVNLVDNAVKFSPGGSVDVCVTNGPTTGSVVLAVRDTGPGIPDDDLEQIFEPFGQAHGDRSGTGLGLSITRDLVEMMGGSIQVRSTVGEGSEFIVSLPLGAPSAHDDDGEGSVAAPDALPAGHRLPRVLVVEDSPINQLLSAGQLESLGCEHLIADSGETALREFDARLFDLVLMDWHLPDMDGLETTRRLRRRERDLGAARTPIVAVTARAMAGDRERCLEAGMDDFLAKPVGLDELARTIHRWLPSEAGRDDDRATDDPATDGDTIDGLVDELGDPVLVARLVEIFLDELPGRRQAIEAAIEAGDVDAVRRSSHALKSSSVVLGVRRLGALASDIETAARSGEVAAATGFDAAAREAESSLRAILADLRSTAGDEGGEEP